MNQSFSLPTLQTPSAVSLPVLTFDSRTTTVLQSSKNVLSPSPNAVALTDRLVQDLTRTQGHYNVEPVDGTKTPVKLTTRLKSYFSSTESIKRLRPIKSLSKLKLKAFGTTPTKTSIVPTALFSSLDPKLESSPIRVRAPQLWSYTTLPKSSFKRPGLSSCIRSGLSLESPPGLNLKEAVKFNKSDSGVMDVVQNPLLGKLSFERQSIDNRAQRTREDEEREAWKKRKSKTGVSWEERLEVLDICRGEISFRAKAEELRPATSEHVVKTTLSSTAGLTTKNPTPNSYILREYGHSNRVMSRRLSRHGLRPSKSFDLDSRLSTIECSPPTSPENSHRESIEDMATNSNSNDGPSSMIYESQFTWKRHDYKRPIRTTRRIASAISLPPLVSIPPLDPTPPSFPLLESPKQTNQLTSDLAGFSSSASVSRPIAPRPSPSAEASSHIDTTTARRSQLVATPSTAPTPISSQPDRPGSIWRTQIIGRYYDTSGFLEGSEVEIDPSPLKGLEWDLARMISLGEEEAGDSLKKDRKDDLPPRLEAHEMFSPILFSLDFSLTSGSAEQSGSFVVERLQSTDQEFSSVATPFVGSRDDDPLHLPRSRRLSVDTKVPLSVLNPFRITTSTNDFTARSESASIPPCHTELSTLTSTNTHGALIVVPVHDALSVRREDILVLPAQEPSITNPIDVPLPPSPSDEISGFSFSAYATLWTPPRQNQPQHHRASKPILTRTSPKIEFDLANGSSCSSSLLPSVSTTSSIIDESNDLSISSNLEIEVKFGTASRLTTSVPRVIYHPNPSVNLQHLPIECLHDNHTAGITELREGEEEEDSDCESEYKEPEGGSELDQDLSPCVVRSVFLSSKVPKRTMLLPQSRKLPSPSECLEQVNRAGPTAISPSVGISFTPSLTLREKSRSSFKLNSSLFAEFGQGALSTSTPTASEVSLQMFRRRIKEVLEAGTEDTFGCSSVETSRVEGGSGPIDQFIAELIIEDRLRGEEDRLLGDEREEDEDDNEDGEVECDDSFTYALEHPEEAVGSQFNLESHLQVSHMVLPASAKPGGRNRPPTHISFDKGFSSNTPHILHQQQHQLEDELEDDHGHSSDLGSTGREIMRLAREKGQSKLLKRAAGRSIRNELELSRERDRKKLRI